MCPVRPRCSGQHLLVLYRECGKAEGHFGELMDVPNPALSASPRPWDDPDKAPAPAPDGVCRNNETLFLPHLLAYQILHTGRTLMEKATGRGWSLRCSRERLLRAAARVLCKSRRLTFVVAWGVADDWHRLWSKMQHYRWRPG